MTLATELTFHEPTHRSAGGSPARFAASSEGAGEPPALQSRRFMVPMHAPKRKEALHEPARRAGFPACWLGDFPVARIAGLESPANPQTRMSALRFMVSMRANSGVGALHEPTIGRADCPIRRIGRLFPDAWGWEHRTGKSGEPAGWKACPTSGFMGSTHEVWVRGRLAAKQWSRSSKNFDPIQLGLAHISIKP